MTLMFRRSSSNRQVHGNYFIGQTLSDEDDSDFQDISTGDLRLDELIDHARRLGFHSLFDACLTQARQFERPTVRSVMNSFVRSGGFDDLYQQFNDAGSFRRQDTSATSALLCQRSLHVYRQEWKELVKCPDLCKPVYHFTPDYVSSFSFTDIYNQMKTRAPNLFTMLGSFVFRSKRSISRPNGPEEEPELNNSSSLPLGITDDVASQRYVVTAIAILANAFSQKINTLQAVYTYYLYASNVPKRVVTVLNHVGVAVSYSSILNALNHIGDAMRKRLSTVASRRQAFQISFDNLTVAANVRDQRLFNESSFITATAGFIVIPPPSRSHAMFKRADVQYSRIKELTTRDFLPTQTDRDTLKLSFRVMISDILKGYAQKSGNTAIKIRGISFQMPKVFQIDHVDCPEILTLPTYNLNEGAIQEIIQILYQIEKDVGLSGEQVKENLIMFKGDFMTVRNTRQTESSDSKKLDYIESSIGLFHLMIQVLELIFDTHLGLDSDLFSLKRWMEELSRDVRKLWNNQRTLVKDFHACIDFFDIVLDGVILAAVAHFCQCCDLPQFAEALETRHDLDAVIEQLSERLVCFEQPSIERSRPSEERDAAFEKVILFLQHGLVLRNFALAMRQGDSGRAVTSINYFVVWFQTTSQTNYAAELLHLVACLRKLWSVGLRQFWMENCLINISGKREGFIACDMFNEYVVRENKAAMHHNVTGASLGFLKDVVSLQVMCMRDVRKKMEKETDTYISDTHSSSVNKWPDVKLVARSILSEGLFVKKSDRGRPAESMAKDLYYDGLSALGKGRIIGNYKAKLATDKQFVYGAGGELEGRSDEDAAIVNPNGESGYIGMGEVDEWV